MADNRKHDFTEDNEIEAEVATGKGKSPAPARPYGQADFDRLDSQLAAIGADPTSQIRDPRAAELSSLLKAYDAAQVARNQRVGRAADVAKYLESESLAKRYVDAANQVNEGQDKANSLKFRESAGSLLEDEAGRDPQSDYSKSYMDELNRVLELDGQAAIPRGRLSANEARKIVDIPKFRVTEKNKLSEGQAKRASAEGIAAESNTTKENVAKTQAGAKIGAAKIQGRVNLAEAEMKQETAKASAREAFGKWAATNSAKLAERDLTPLGVGWADRKNPPSQVNANKVAEDFVAAEKYREALEGLRREFPAVLSMNIPWTEKRSRLVTSITDAVEKNVKFEGNGVANGADLVMAAKMIGDEDSFMQTQFGPMLAKIKRGLEIIDEGKRAVAKANKYVYPGKGGADPSLVSGGFGSGYGGPSSSSSGPVAPGGGTYTRQAAESLGMTPAAPPAAPPVSTQPQPGISAKDRLKMKLGLR